MPYKDPEEQKAYWRSRNPGNLRRARKKYKNDPAFRERAKRYAWAYHLKHDYGLTPAEYEARLEEQNRTCLICGYTANVDATKGQQLGLDHNHTTGQLRGFLCNKSLGGFRDSPELLDKAASYLRSFQ